MEIMDLGLKGKCVALTGGTKSIGRAIVDGAMTARVQH
jgi:NAD(P)-dependent dehydrogenase (short-subunit alcohol dehydrogenase family)